MEHLSPRLALQESVVAVPGRLIIAAKRFDFDSRRTPVIERVKSAALVRAFRATSHPGRGSINKVNQNVGDVPSKDDESALREVLETQAVA